MKTVLSVRPAGDRLQQRVEAFLETMGFYVEESRTVPARTSDELAAKAVLKHRDVDLLLLPYHLHRDSADRVVDGFGVLRHLDARFYARGIPIVMPVSTFSLASSFERRMEDLRQQRSPAIELLIPLPEDEIGAPGARFRIQKLSSKRSAQDSGVVLRGDSERDPRPGFGRG